MNNRISEDVMKNLAILFLYLIDNMLNPRYDSIVEQVFQYIDYMIYQRDNISDYLVNNNISEDVTRILRFSFFLSLIIPETLDIISSLNKCFNISIIWLHIKFCF